MNEGLIFKAFVGAKASGGGLGLTVSRDIVESHGGVIFIESRPGAGTKVQVLLPGREDISCWGWRSRRIDDGRVAQEVDCGVL